MVQVDSINTISSVILAKESFCLTDDELTSDSDPPEECYIPASYDLAAYSSRLVANQLSDLERTLFPYIGYNRSNQEIFLYIRNHILYLWLQNSKQELLYLQVIDKLHPPYSHKPTLCKQIYDYLIRYSYINFGLYARHTTPIPYGKKILILGAGISGLCAARQLAYFGFDVHVIEGRDYVGGRIDSFRHEDYCADNGAMVVTGLGGNPLAVLESQVNLELSPIKQRCPLYDCQGKMVPRDRDKLVEGEFNKLLESASEVSHHYNFNSYKDRKLSLGEILDAILRLKKFQVKQAYMSHLKSIINLQDKIKTILEEMETVSSLIKDTHQKLSLSATSGIEKAVVSGVETENFNITTGKLNRHFAAYDKLNMELFTIRTKLSHLISTPISEEYLSLYDIKIMGWHFANLEFANAACLEDLSLQHWDQDDDFEFTGYHHSVKNGFSTLPTRLSEGLNIHFSTAARIINYTPERISVEAENILNGTRMSFTADAVLCTLPLGVLKRSECILFNPPLPKEKQTSIENMGFGLLNKMILCFREQFWNPDIQPFGYVNPESQGEMFLFWNLSHKPLLLVLIAGKAAIHSENIEEEVLLEKAMCILKKIFGDRSVTRPFKWHITNWGRDPFCFGSYSYVGVDCSGKDYDNLAVPVALHDGSTDGHIPKLFFAGEHTMRNYPATVHGAILSGFREVGRITEIFNNLND